MSFTLAAPAPYFSVQAQSGTQYTADSNGVITGVAQNDLASLLDDGCVMPGFFARLIGADMNATTDQSFTLVNTKLPYRITKIAAIMGLPAVSLTTAVGGVYVAAAKAGTAVVANTQAFSALTAANLAVDLTIVSGQGAIVRAAGLVPILSLTTAQGAAATADLYLYADLLG